MIRITRHVLTAMLLLLAGGAAAQEADVRARLTERGLAPELVAAVVAVADDAAAAGLPVHPLADKALEGWAKHVPPNRIVAVIRQLAARMTVARDAVRSAGVSAPPGAVIAAAAEAMGRGMEAEHVGAVVRAAPSHDVAAPGLTVAAALAAQGIEVSQAVSVVVEAMRRGESVAQLLDMPSLARAMGAQGLSPAEIGQRMMQGAGAMGGMAGQGMGARPGGVPPAKGPPQTPPTGRGRQRRP